MRLKLILVLLCSVAVTTFAMPTNASAIGSSDLITGSSNPDRIHLTTRVSRHTINYTITNVPETNIVTPRACNTLVINVVRAGLAALPVVLGGFSSDSINLRQLIANLNRLGALPVAPQLLKRADKSGVVTGSFENVPGGNYLVATLCNINPTQPVASIDASLIGLAYSYVFPGFGSS